MKILFVTPYPYSTAPSQRFRFEQYYPVLKEAEVEVKIQSFLDETTWQILYHQGKKLQKGLGIIKGFLRRFAVLFTLGNYDFVFIHREASPIGPPVFEWLIAKVFGKKVIYDFDDAIWIPNTSEQNKIAAGLKWHHKVRSICKWSYKISAGNDYLAEYARQFNPAVIVNPTTIDLENVHNLVKQPGGRIGEIKTGQAVEGNEKTIIGWTGSHSTLPYLNDIIETVKELEKNYPIEFCVISNKNPQFQLASFSFVKWNKETEIEDLIRFDLGLMPLTDDRWANGKCGFKALQYMALGIPPLVSPVGVNTKIVDHGRNGFVCKTREDWLDYIQLLLGDFGLRKTLGLEARKTVEEKYSVKSNTENFLGLFR